MYLYHKSLPLQMIGLACIYMHTRYLYTLQEVIPKKNGIKLLRKAFFDHKIIKAILRKKNSL